LARPRMSSAPTRGGTSGLKTVTGRAGASVCAFSHCATGPSAATSNRRPVPDELTSNPLSRVTYLRDAFLLPAPFDTLSEITADSQRMPASPPPSPAAHAAPAVSLGGGGDVGTDELRGTIKSTGASGASATRRLPGMHNRALTCVAHTASCHVGKQPPWGKRWLEMFLSLWRATSGSSLIEYSWLIGIVIAVVIVGVALAGMWMSDMWERLFSTVAP